MFEKVLTVGALMACVAIAACGGTTEQRAATGGLGGAATGAVIGGPVGAAVGGAAGAGAGAVMDRGAEEHIGDAVDDVTD
jgi:hypothetical protein